LAELHVIHPNGFHWGSNKDKIRTIDGSGRYSWPWTPDNSAPIGIYRYWAVDRSSGKKAPEITFEVLGNQTDTGSIFGGISDDIDRKPITNAVVYLKRNGSEVDKQDVHSISAQYNFVKLPVGNYTAEAQAPGYVKKARIIQVYKDQQAEGNITLKKEGSASDDIAQFISKSLADGITIETGKRFTQTFTFENRGGNTWRYYYLGKVSGNSMGAGNQIPFSETRPGEKVNIGISMYAPYGGGDYESSWQLYNSDDSAFGPIVNLRIKVIAPVITDNAKFVKHIDSGDIDELRPGQSFQKKWLVQNNGTTEWNLYAFVRADGYSFIYNPIIKNTPNISQGENWIASVNIIAPDQPGEYQANWQMKNLSGDYFGDQFPLKIKVIQPGQQTTQEGNGTSTESNPNGATSTDPVNLANGNYYYEHVDLAFAGPLGTSFRRTYNVLDNYDGPLGYNWSHNFDTVLSPSEFGLTFMRTGDGRAAYFKKISDYQFESISRSYESLEIDEDGNYIFTFKNGRKQHYSWDGSLLKLEDRNGRITRCNYDEEGMLAKVVDPAGREMFFSYDGLLRITTISDGLRAVQYRYDEIGDLVGVIDALGNETKFEYENHRLIRVVDPKGQTIVENQFDSEGKCIFQKDAFGNETILQYDLTNGKASETDPRGYTTEYTFEGVNRLMKVDDPLGFSESYEYDENDNRISITDKNGNRTTYEYNDFGQVTHKTDPTGFSTQYQYDENGNLLSIIDDIGTVQEIAYDNRVLPNTIVDGRGVSTNLEFDQNGNLVSREIGQSRWQFAYDYLGRRLSSRGPLGNLTRIQYDAMGRVVESVNERNYTTTYEYDENGSRIAITDPKGNTSSYVYDEKDQLVKETDPLNYTTEYIYDEVGNRISVKDALNFVARFEYDGMNQLVKKIDPLNNETSYEYDKNGNRILTTNGRGFQTRYAFDAMNRVETVADALNNTTNFVYDGRRRLISETDANGNTQSYNYDDSGNLIRETDALGNDTQYTYDVQNNRTEIINPSGGKSTFTYDAKNQLTASTDFMAKTETFEYDPAGNISIATDFMGYTTTYTYDENNNRVTAIDAGGVRSVSAYDAANRLINISDPLGNTTQQIYDALGRRIRTVDGNGIAANFSYDPLSRLIQVYDANGGITRYVYDPVGNLEKIIDAIGNQTGFEYDPVNRLLKEITPLKFEHTYTYDAVGNKISEKDANGQNISFSLDANNRLVTATYSDNTISYQYNENSMAVEISDNSGTIQRTYDNANRLLEEIQPHGAVSYTYSGPDRISMTYPDRKLLTYEYSNHRLTAMNDWEDRRTEYQYTPSGFLQDIQYPNGAGIRYQYDAANRLVLVENYGANNQPMISFEYSLDRVGNRTEMIRKRYPNITLDRIIEEDGVYEFSAAISEKLFPNGSGQVIIANGFNYSDVMAMAPVMTKTNIPVLFVDPHDLERSQAAKTELQRLVAKSNSTNALIIGGYHAISDRIDAQLEELSFTVTRFTGLDRFDIASKITSFNNGVSNTTKATNGGFENYAIIINGLKEDGAIAVAPFAAKYNVPILLTKPDNLPETTKEALKHLGIQHTLLVGSDFNSGVKDWLNSNGYSVNKVIDSENSLENQLAIWEWAGIDQEEKIYITNSENYSDVLSVSALAVRNDALLVLTKEENIGSHLKDFLEDQGNKIKSISFLGGENTISEKVVFEIYDAVATIETVNYTYDNLYQLTKEAYSNGDFIGYVYVAAGNRLTKTENSDITNYEYDADNRLTSTGTISFGYDNNGNRIRKTENNQTTTYIFDDLNRLTQATLPGGTTNTFVYDAEGKRLSKTTSRGARKYVYDIDDIVIELDGNNEFVAAYLTGLGIDDIILRDTGTETVHYQKDALGSTIALSDNNGNVNDETEYTAFGNSKEGASLSAEHGFTARMYEKDIELHYYRSRFYDSDVGQFLTRDIESPIFNNPLSLHRFVYVENNPIKYLDPFGFSPREKIEDIFSVLSEVSLAGIKSSLRSIAIEEIRKTLGTSINEAIRSSAHNNVDWLNKILKRVDIAGEGLTVIDEYKNILKELQNEGIKIEEIPSLFTSDWRQMSNLTTDDILDSIAEGFASVTAVSFNTAASLYIAEVKLITGKDISISGDQVKQFSEKIVEKTGLDDAFYWIGKKFGVFY